jgi:hypothetical protein
LRYAIRRLGKRALPAVGGAMLKPFRGVNRSDRMVRLLAVFGVVANHQALSAPMHWHGRFGENLWLRMLYHKYSITAPAQRQYNNYR